MDDDAEQHVVVVVVDVVVVPLTSVLFFFLMTSGRLIIRGARPRRVIGDAAAATDAAAAAAEAAAADAAAAGGMSHQVAVEDFACAPLGLPYKYCTRAVVESFLVIYRDKISQSSRRVLYCDCTVPVGWLFSIRTRTIVKYIKISPMSI